VTRFPVVLMGTEYWGGLLDWIRATMQREGKIGPNDLDLICLTDDPDEAVRHIVAADRALNPDLNRAQEAAASDARADAAEADAAAEA
jgi:predicted Rossmann-fold nucleotide-binding protein